MNVEKPLHVVHVVEALTGGVYSYFVDLSHYFDKDKRIKTTIVYSDKRVEIDKNRLASDFSTSVRLIRCSMERAINPLRDLQSLFSLTKILKQEKPDIVHLHSTKAGVIGRLAFKLALSKGQLFYTPHGYSFLQQDYGKVKRFLFKSVEKYSQKILGGITIACGDTEAQHAKAMGLTTILTRNGVNVNNFEYAGGTASSNTVFGMLGRITYPRNPAYVNHIASLLPTSQFVWIGDGELRNMITSKNIKITGWFTDRNQALEQLKSLDVFVHMSLWEGLPIALLEAMAMGKPIIASNVIGNKDAVVHGVTGFLVSNEDEFVQAARQLMDHELREKMGKAGRTRVESIFDCNKNFKSLADLYLSCSNMRKQIS